MHVHVYVQHGEIHVNMCVCVCEGVCSYAYSRVYTFVFAWLLANPSFVCRPNDKQDMLEGEHARTYNA